MTAPSDLLPFFPHIQSVRDIQDTDVTRSLSGKIFARERGPLRFEVALQYRPMTQAQAAQLKAFLADHAGPANPFYIALDQPKPGAFEQIGNFVNWSDSPLGKVYRVVDTEPTRVQPPAPAGNAVSTAAAPYMRVAMKSNTQQYQEERTGLVTLSLTVEEHLL